MNLTTFHPVLLAVLLLTTYQARSEPSTEASGHDKDKPVRHLRILPVGDSPPFMQEVRDGVRYEVDPPAESLPPRELLRRQTQEETQNPETEKPSSIPLHLNRISPQANCPPGAESIDFIRAGETAESPAWLRVKLPEEGDAMVLLWRDPKEKSWNKAASLVLPDGGSGNPAGSVRFINLFPTTLRIVWGSDKLLLKSGASFTRRIKPGTDVAFEILSVGPEGSPRRYYSNQITQNAGERGFIVIYQADGESPRRPLKTLVFREPLGAEKSP